MIGLLFALALQCGPADQTWNGCSESYTALNVKVTDTAPDDGLSVLVGATLSGGLGEHLFAPIAEARIDSGGWRLSGDGTSSRKLESGKGYILGAQVERYLGPVILSARGRYRNGGAWSKSGVWPGIGLGSRNLNMILRREIRTAPDKNDTWSLTGTAGHGRVEFQIAAYSYHDTFHRDGPRSWGVVESVGVRLGGR